MAKIKSRIDNIVQDYLDSWKDPYSDLDDLDPSEKMDLLNTIQEETGILLDEFDMQELSEKIDLSINDIIERLDQTPE
ncbi:MAG TPA: hypothetical protein DHD79_00725 [Firmicutes bacterium]|nr:hypothetical protein [Bacillota bacterium]HAW71408.1 hypothetical protein [Bacillota bacterium]HAZ20826.1 hypothetical protein [Bacillota bacterium]HBE05426.1 hypothetical protein [Bacillota bacterium]HBG45299.1 hypothetical protein [Bacillota bacterium]